MDGPMTTYDIDIYRDEAGYWIADVPSVPGAHSFAKRIDQITSNIREAIAVALDIDDTDAIEINPRVALGSSLEKLLGEARHLRDVADQATQAASEASREAARALVEQGELSLRDAGALLGVSHQRVGQLVKS